MGRPTPGKGGSDHPRYEPAVPANLDADLRSPERRVSRTAAKDYIYGRIAQLERIILSEKGSRRQEARKERAFLKGQINLVYVEDDWQERLDPALVEAVRQDATGSNSAGQKKPPKSNMISQPAESADSGSSGPSYRARCEKMNFSELRAFIDDSLQELSSDTRRKDSPHEKEEFLVLLELLSGKVGDEVDGAPAGSASLAFEGGKLKKLRRHRSNLIKALARARSKLSSSTDGTTGEFSDKVRNLRAELELVEAKIDRLQGQNKGRPTMSHAEAQRPRNIRSRRTKFVRRIGRDIERIFADGGPGRSAPAEARSMSTGARRLPWRVLPPGERSLEKVLAHYEKLGRARPDVRYEPKRIRKAYSLGPDGCYVGVDEFDGYVVFTFPYTKKALLERPVYGNAIYVLGPEWKRLSRLSKRDLLADQTLGVTKIVHKGDWFARTRAALGLR